MRFLIFSFILFGINSLLSAQNSFSGYEIGHYVDTDGQLIEGYLDPSYAPKKPLSLVHNLFENFTPGKYYTNETQPIEGYIKLDYTNKKFEFKEVNDEDTKSEKIDVGSVRAVVVGTDSLVSIRNFYSNTALGTIKVSSSYLAEVMDEFYGFTFYKLFTSSINDGKPTYFYATEEVKLYCISDNKNKFSEIVSELFSEYAYLSKKIANKDYNYSDFPSLIKIFKYYKMYQKNTPLLLDNYWGEVKEGNQYYAEIESVKDSVFHVAYYFKDSTKIYDADLISFYPHEYVNTLTLYYPGGGKRKRIYYKNEEPFVGFTYYPKGGTHRIYVFKENHLIYRNVYNSDSVDILDKKGSGVETFLDSITGKKLTYTYEAKVLHSVYYENNGKRIYQWLDGSNTSESLLNSSFQKRFNNKISFTDSALMANKHGLLLLKVTLNSSRHIETIEVLKSFSPELDKEVISYLDQYKEKKGFKRVYGMDKSVKQELVLPIEFSIRSVSSYNRNYYYDYYFYHWWWHQQQMHNYHNIYTPPTNFNYIQTPGGFGF